MSERTCNKCGGTGAQLHPELTAPSSPCWQCGGTGYVSVVTLACAGCLEKDQRVAELEALLKSAAGRINAAESTLLNAKAERECVTLQDWKLRAQYYEYQWGSCSNFANREIPKWQTRAEAAEAALEEIAEETDAGNICVSAEHKIDHIRAILAAALEERGDE